ncbi:receptor activity-modifying protein 2 [Leptodactylus fuscus]|uniref:receptor activity-modifying protein 2 n=1 Tax=Leptodactylus fuscus TaxID=238119 RepID=UPI003F4ED4E5
MESTILCMLTSALCLFTWAYGSMTALENVTQPTVNMVDVNWATANISNVTLHQGFNSTGAVDDGIAAAFKMIYNCAITNMSEVSLYREIVYEAIVQKCWENFTFTMSNVEHEHWCDWEHIVSHYSSLQYCLEIRAEAFCLPFPNELAHHTFLRAHTHFFLNCSLLSEELMDPPENILFGLIFTPICIIPFLVALVVYKSNTSKPQT